MRVYGSEKFAQEFKYCVDEILKVSMAGPNENKLRDLLFQKQTTNPFPSVFAVIVIAFHELVVKEGKQIADYLSVQKALSNLNTRIETGRRATSPEERRKNIDVVKGLVANFCIPAQSPPAIYGNHATMDIEALIRRSEIELSDYELKQGLLTLSAKRELDPTLPDKVIKTICAIANNGPQRSGKIVIGVTDKQADADKISELDGIKPKKVGKRFVVGISREARFMNTTLEAYFSKWKTAIKNSALSQHLKDQVLSHLDFNDFYGLGVIIITVPPQKELSYVDEEVGSVGQVVENRLATYQRVI